MSVPVITPKQPRQTESVRKISLSDFPQQIQDDVWAIFARAAARKAKREAGSYVTQSSRLG